MMKQTAASDLLHDHRFRAMGSEIVIWLEQEDEQLAKQRLQQAQAMFDRAEACMTRFDPNSELSRLNAQPGKWVTLSRVLWRVVEQAWQLAAATEGLFDPTLLNAIEAAGYTRSFGEDWAWEKGRQPDPAGANTKFSDVHRFSKGAPDRSLVTWRHVQRDPASHALLLPEGLRLDLGGIGKGFTAQQVVNFLSLWGPCLVDAGGDIVTGDAPQGWPGWLVEIAKPWPMDRSFVGDSFAGDDNQATVAEVWLNNGTLATSGIDYRWWMRDGQRQHHLIDPRTGNPAATDLLTATILSADACRAEAWATAALVAGMQAAQNMFQREGIAGLLIDQSMQVYVTESMQGFVKE